MTDNVTITWAQFTEWISDPAIAGFLGGLTLIYVLGFCSIFARAGFHWALGTLMLVPGVNLVLFLLLSIASWPKSRELRSLRKLENVVTEAESRHRRVA